MTARERIASWLDERQPRHAEYHRKVWGPEDYYYTCVECEEQVFVGQSERTYCETYAAMQGIRTMLAEVERDHDTDAEEMRREKWHWCVCGTRWPEEAAACPRAEAIYEAIWRSIEGQG